MSLRIVTPGTRSTISAASESGFFLNASALMLSSTVVALRRSASWTDSAAFLAFATTSTTSIPASPADERVVSATNALPPSIFTAVIRALR